VRQAADDATELMLWFRRAFVLKIALHELVPGKGLEVSAWEAALVVIGAAMAFRRSGARLGLWLLFALRAADIAGYFPYAGNHWFLEAAVLLILAAAPTPSSVERQIRVANADQRSLVLQLILSVWLYAGIQKLFHGYYWNGEALAHRALFEPAPWLGPALRMMLQAFSTGDSGIDFERLPFAWPEFDTRGGSLFLPLPLWAVAFFLITSWAIVLAEIACPILVWFERSREIGLHGLLLVVGLVGATSLELSFTLDNLLCLGLLSRADGRRTYGWLSALTVVAFLARVHSPMTTSPPQTWHRSRVITLFVIGWIWLWPPLHMIAARTLDFSPWKFGGWGMYSTPHPELSRSLRVLAERRGRWRPLKIEGLTLDEAKALQEAHRLTRFHLQTGDAKRLAELLLASSEEARSAERLLILATQQRIDLFDRSIYEQHTSWVWKSGAITRSPKGTAAGEPHRVAAPLPE
jgi:hypothetical protein